MTHSRKTLPLVACGLLFSLTLGEVVAQQSGSGGCARQPADILSYLGAPWLERHEREAMEKPEQVLDALKIQPGDVVADVGAGSGFFTVKLSRRVGPTGKVYAVDIQKEMLDLIRQKIDRMGLGNIEPVLGETADPHLPPQAIDLIFIVDAYHEFQEPLSLVKRLREALKPDGRLMIIEYKSEYAYIRPLHKMEESQIVGELKLGGFTLSKRFDLLENQHMLIFKKGGSQLGLRKRERVGGDPIRKSILGYPRR